MRMSEEIRREIIRNMADFCKTVRKIDPEEALLDYLHMFYKLSPTGIPARTLRRRSRSVSGEVILSDGSHLLLDRPTLLRPLERALSALSWGVVALSVGLVASRVL